MSGNSHTCVVTVLMPVYNAAPFLREAIDSILSQTFRDFELLIINDGSTDQSREIILSYSDSRIRLLDNPGNIGLIATLNRGIREARGKYIARMDADDVSLPTRLEKQAGTMKADPAIAVHASFVEFINTDSEVTGHWSTDREAVSENEIRKLLMKTNCIAHPSVMIRKEVVEKYFYHPKRKGAEDWDLWMRMMAAGERIAKLPEVLLKYRVHPGSVSSGDRAEDVLEVRLMRIKWKFLWSQFAKLKLNGFFFGVKISFLKNLARHLVSNKFPSWARDAKRYLTSPPWTVIAQGKKFRTTLDQYNGKYFFIFPYMHVGGAENVHAAIVETVADKKPLVIFSAFSDNRKFLERFTRNAEVLDVAHYVNYPLTRKKAKRLLSGAVNRQTEAVLFGSNSGLFYDLVPLVAKHVQVIDLIHAFKYQPEANFAHRQLIHLATRIDHRIFVSSAAKEEFDRFCFYNNIPRAIRNRLKLISNAVDVATSLPTRSGERTGLLFVGRNSPEKRINLFLEVATQLQREAAGQFRFTIVGANNEWNEQSVNFMGEITEQDQMQKIYREHDILIVTSEREGFPVVIMEAMANGLVVIATPVGDIPNRLDNKNGIVLISSDAKDVVSETLKQVKMLAGEPDKMSAIRSEAHRYALDNFSMARFRKDYRKLFGESD